jgi:SAM-dependent methyltransferase
VNEQTPYDEIGAGFGRAAACYDREIGANPAMRYMRRVSLETLDTTFPPGQRVIEIGCGTGIEAVHLARRGIRVLATDLSPEMVDLTARRAARAGVQDMVQTRHLAAGELGVLLDEYERGSFDGAYSSFGPLNGEPNLRAVSASLAGLIRPSGALVVSVMNRFYLFETIWALAHGHPRQAVRRWNGTAMAGVSPTLPDVIPTWYHSPRAFARAFAPAFYRVGCQALPLLLPPPPLAHAWVRAPGLVSRLAKYEEMLASRPFFCALGDHFMMRLRRTTRDLERA